MSPRKLALARASICFLSDARGGRPLGYRAALRIQVKQAAGRVHTGPVILVGSAASQTDLIVSAIVVEPRPGKTVSAPSSEDPFQKAHLLTPLRGICRCLLIAKSANGHSSVGQSRCSEAYFRPLKGQSVPVEVAGKAISALSELLFKLRTCTVELIYVHRSSAAITPRFAGRAISILRSTPRRPFQCWEL